MTHVLIVEDHEESRTLLKMLLGANGYRVTAAGDGLEALIAARRDPPDAVISDVLMPKMDGFTLCRAWMEDAALKAIPFIFYSGHHVRPNDAQFGLALGAVRYLTKPLEAEVLLQELRAVLEQWSARPAPGPAAPLDDITFRTLHESALTRTIDDKIAQLEAANCKLQESEARFRSMAEMSSDFYWESDAEHRVTQRTAGRDSDAPWEFWAGTQIGKRRWEVPYLSPDEAGWAAHRTVLDAHLPFRNFELSRTGADGNEYFRSISGDPVFDASGAFKGYRGVGTDITARKRAEEALRLSDQRLQEAVRASGIGIYDHDHDAGTIYWSPRQRDIYGWGPDEPVTLKRFVDQVYPEDRKRIADAVRRAHDPGGDGRFDVEHRIVRRDGAIRWLTTRSQTFYQGEAKERRPVRTIGAVLDTTERKLAEEALMRESRLNQAYLRSASDGVHILDADGNVLQVSDSLCDMLGYAREELIGANVSLWDTQWSPPELKQIIAGQIAKEELSVFETRHRRRDGSILDVEVTGRGLELDGKRVLFNSARDITGRKQAEEKLHLAASVFTYAREGILITSGDGTIIDANDTCCLITGYTRDEVLGRNPRIFSSGRQSKEFYAAMWGKLIEDGHWSGELWNRRKNGELYVESLTISAVRDAQGNSRHYVALFADVTAAKEHEKQLEHIAHYDALTGLPNRVLLADRLHQAMAQAHRRAQPLAVAYLDLDGFKVINDRHGHDTGDQLLMTMAASMKQVLREGDTLSRLGGDEFVAVLLDLPDVEASAPMLARLLAAAAQPVQVKDLVLEVSASLGVTFYPQAEDVDADQLLRQADQAMYQAKLSGKNRYHVFDAEQDRSVRGHHESLVRIRHALIEREFVLHYQPKVNMRTGAVIGAEALIRWEHPEKGLLLPAVFLPVIEDHPLAVEIGEWVIDTALTQMTHWQASGLDIPVSVNVGARQLQQAGFPQRLRKILAAHPKVRSGDLELEVLETSALEDVAGVSLVLEACREIGVLFALDDFGTGYSSLSYLKRLPVNRLKIDQSFVRDMLEDPDDLAILEGVIGLATAFRREVIAEGMETVEHGEMLLQLGCEMAQGYGIVRPMPARELSGWSATWRPAPSWINCRPVSRDNLPLLFASVEHRAWIATIEAFLEGERDNPPPLDHHQCHFGKWLDAERLARHGAQAVFHNIDPLHRQVHALAAELCELRDRGRKPEALARLGELHGLRDALLEQMKALSQEERQ